MKEEQKTTKISKELVMYLVMTFAIGWACQFAASYFVMNGRSDLFTPLLSFAMVAPIATVFILYRGLAAPKTGIQGWMPQFKGRMGRWFLVWIAPVVLTALGMVAYYGVFPARFDPTASSYLTAALGQEMYEQMYAGVSAFQLCGVQVINILFAALINMFLAIGEETGWRGWMQPRLAKQIGRARANVVTGLVWGVWHWPVIMLAGYEYQMPISQSPWYMVLAGMLLFCLVTVALSFVLDWCYEKTGSIWAPALFHGGFNAAAGLGILFLRMEYAKDTLMGPMPVGVLGALPLFICGALLYWKERKAD